MDIVWLISAMTTYSEIKVGNDVYLENPGLTTVL